MTSDALKSHNLGNKRTGLGSSLINFAMEDLTLSSKAKSVYNAATAKANNSSGSKIGGMFSNMNMGSSVSGMFMMNNNHMLGQMGYNANDDNCSLLSGATFQPMQNFANPMSLLHKKND